MQSALHGPRRQGLAIDERSCRRALEGAHFKTAGSPVVTASPSERQEPRRHPARFPWRKDRGIDAMNPLKTLDDQIDAMLKGFIQHVPSLTISLVVLIVTWLLAKSAVRITYRLTRN